MTGEIVTRETTVFLDKEKVSLKKVFDEEVEVDTGLLSYGEFT